MIGATIVNENIVGTWQAVKRRIWRRQLCGTPNDEYSLATFDVAVHVFHLTTRILAH